jgi:hypothetical protein
MQNKKNQTSVAEDTGPFSDSQAGCWLSGPQTDVPAEPFSPNSWGLILRMDKFLPFSI